MTNWYQLSRAAKYSAGYDTCSCIKHGHIRAFLCVQPQFKQHKLCDCQLKSLSQEAKLAFQFLEVRHRFKKKKTLKKQFKSEVFKDELKQINEMLTYPYR